MVRKHRVPIHASNVISEEIHIPNYSGDHSEGSVEKSPTDGKDIVNKDYVDNEIRNRCVRPVSATFAGDPNGVSGTAGTAQTIITRVVPAKTLIRRGERLRIRTWAFITGGATITITTKLNGVIISDIPHTGSAQFDLTEAWCHYVDNEHFNNIEQEGGSGIGDLTEVNVAGVDWSVDQNITIEQTSAVGSFATIYGVFVDVFPYEF